MRPCSSSPNLSKVPRIQMLNPANAPEKILLIDNSEEDYLRTRDLLETRSAHRYSLDWAPAYSEGRRVMKRGKHAAYLLDCDLDGRDGLALLREMIAARCTAPIIVLADESDQDADDKAMELGAADFLVKDQLNAVLLDQAIRHAIERANFQNALRRSEQRFRTLFENSPDAIFVVDSESIVLAANRAAARLHAAARTDLVGKNLLDLIPPDQGKTFKHDLPALTANQSQLANVSWNRGDQSVATEITAMRIEYDERPAVLLHVRDVSDHKRAEERLRASGERLRSLSRRLQTAQESERKRIARAVHDELGGELTGLKLDVAWLAKHLAEVPEAAAKPAFAEKLNAMSTMLDSTIEFVRQITTQLRPGVLDILGFAAAIEWQAREFEQRTGIVCEVHSPESDIAVDADRSTALFRIFQEILTNIARHAQATKIAVRMTEAANSFVLEVHDNGRGISDTEIADPKSLGLLGMRERALVFGGQVSFKSVPNEGTTVTVWVPLEN
jgi:PAS domain S-box-containing protein